MIEATLQQTRKRILIGAVLWLLCLQFFVAERIAAQAFSPTYSFASGYISDLGTTDCDLAAEFPACSPRHIYMNLSFMAQGVLMVVGAFAVRRSFNSRVGFNVATGAIVISGIGVFWMGAAPSSVAQTLHTIAMNFHLMCGGLGILLFGAMLFVRPAGNILAGLVSVFAGIPISMAAVLMAAGNVHAWEAIGLPPGMLQRVAAYGIPLWLATMGVILLTTRGREAQPLPGIYLPPPPPPRMRES